MSRRLGRAPAWICASVAALGVAACVYDFAGAERCSNGVQDPGETDVDCGGECAPCSSTTSSSSSGGMPTPTCHDHEHNGDESDVDCGGTECDPCALGQKCHEQADCADGLCSKGYCTPLELTRRWRNLEASGSLSGRYGIGMAYRNPDRTVVMFGGFSDHAEDQTWFLTGSSWKNSNTYKPTPRISSAMAFDGTRMVVVGGIADGPDGFRESWELTTAGWHQGPLPIEGNYGGAMAYDPVRDVMVLFGGLPTLTGAPVDHTSERDSSGAWSVPPAGPAPSARYYFPMVYDVKGKRMVLFGGRNGSSSNGETWQYVAGASPAWTSLTTAHSPFKRFGHAMAYDTVRDRIVLTGGSPVTDGFETWEFDGMDWTRMRPEYPSDFADRIRGAMVYDPDQQRMVLFGGCTTPDLAAPTQGTFIYYLVGQPCVSDATCMNGTKCADGLCCDLPQTDHECADPHDVCNSPKRPGVCGPK